MILKMEPITCGRCGHEEWEMEKAVDHQVACRPLKKVPIKKKVRTGTLNDLLELMKESA
jgi:hypothetical protein